MFTGNLGFRVFKLDTSNIRAWEPDRDDLEGTLLDSTDHIKQDRSEEGHSLRATIEVGVRHLCAHREPGPLRVSPCAPSAPAR